MSRKTKSAIIPALYQTINSNPRPLARPKHMEQISFAEAFVTFKPFLGKPIPQTGRFLPIADKCHSKGDPQNPNPSTVFNIILYPVRLVDFQSPFVPEGTCRQIRE
jgi:hypothetical protein